MPLGGKRQPEQAELWISQVATPNKSIKDKKRAAYQRLWSLAGGWGLVCRERGGGRRQGNQWRVQCCVGRHFN